MFGEVVLLLLGSLFVLFIYNYGVFLSLGVGMLDVMCNIVFIYGVLVILVGLFVWVLCLFMFCCIEVIVVVCILGGGLSNLFDCCVYDGWVFDFLNMGIG